MVDREYITANRVGDDEPVHMKHADIIAVVTNANELGPIDGTTAIYFRHGFAIAVNGTPGEIMELIRQKELSQ